MNNKSSTAKRLRIATLAASITMALSMTSTQLHADAAGNKRTAPLKPDVPYVFVVHNGRSVRVERDVYDSLKARANIRGMMLQQSDACPPFCLSPLHHELPVETYGEAELIDFFLNKLRDESGTLVDVRSKREYDKATIPGSVNFFIQDVQKGPGDKKFDAMLESFGAKRHDGISAMTKIQSILGLKDISLQTEAWDFTDAKELVVWTNSAMEPTASRVISLLHDAGYPTSKLKWFRGGMAAWQFWGFNTVGKRKR